MATVIGKHFTPAERKKVYLILLFLSLGLLSLAIWQARPVLVEVSDPLGLINYLAPAYWAGLALLLLASIAAFLDTEMKSDLIYILLLLALGLFLVGIAVFLYESTRNPDVYYPNSEVYRLVAEGHFDSNTLPLGSYYSWPATTIVNAATVLLTGINGDFIQDFVKYMPLFWVLFFTFIVYGLGQRLGVSPRLRFLLSYLAASSWWLLDNYQPASWSVLLYLLVFVLLLKPRTTANESLTIIILFGGLLTTHGFQSVMLVPPLVMVSLYRRDGRLLLLFAVLFGAWYIYQASAAFSQGVSQALASPFWRISEVANAERYALPSAAGRLFARYSQLAYLAVYLALVGGSSVLLFRGRIGKEHRRLSLFCLFWVVGVAASLPLGLATEVQRFYHYAVVPAVVIVVLAFGALRARLVIALVVATMSITLALNLPAKYTLEAAWIQVPAGEFAGSGFFVHRVGPGPGDVRFLNNSSQKILEGFDPSMGQTHPLHISTLPPWPSIDFSEIDAKANYVLIGRSGSDSELLGYGQRAYSAWPQTEAGKQADLLYDNGEFKVYFNPRTR